MTGDKITPIPGMFSDFEENLAAEIPKTDIIKQSELDLDQKTFEWFKSRCGRFTGSKFPDLMKGGRSGAVFGDTAKKVIRKAAMERMMSQDGLSMYIQEQMSKNFRQCKWGNDYEPEARIAYMEETGFGVQETGFKIHPKYDFVGGSFDGEVNTSIDEGIIEIKCPYDPDVHAGNRDLMLSGGITQKHTYYPQIQINIEIAGVEWCDFVSYDPRMQDEFKLVIIRVPRNQEFIDNMLRRVEWGQQIANLYMGGKSIDTAIAEIMEAA